MRTAFGDLPEHLARHASMAEQHEYLHARLSRRAVLRGAGLVVATPYLWRQPSAAAADVAVPAWTAYGDDPRRQVVVSFAVPAGFRSAVVEVGPDPGLGRRVEVDVRTVPGVQTAYGHALVDGLEPGGTYRYRVLVDGTAVAGRTVTTAPARPGPFTFTAFGDQGVSGAARDVLAQVDGLRPAFHLLAGDLCYADSAGTGAADDAFDPTVWDGWLQMISPVASRTPWMCVPGNHEMEPGFGPQGYAGLLSRFRLPGSGPPGCPTAYAFRYGGVGVVCLDANDVSVEIPHNRGWTGGRQTAWLADQLARLRDPASGVDFVVVAFHHCAYGTSTRHGSDGGVRDEWVPLFDAHGVDLVVNGHAHVYERTAQLRRGTVTAAAPRGARVDASAGTVYVTAGGGGRAAGYGFTAAGSVVNRDGGAREPETAPWSLPATRRTDPCVLRVDVAPGTGSDDPSMRVRAVSAAGDVVDEVTLVRPRRGAGGVDRWVAGAGVAGAAGAVALARARAGTRREAAARRAAGAATGPPHPGDH